MFFSAFFIKYVTSLSPAFSNSPMSTLSLLFFESMLPPTCRVVYRDLMHQKLSVGQYQALEWEQTYQYYLNNHRLHACHLSSSQNYMSVYAYTCLGAFCIFWATSYRPPIGGVGHTNLAWRRCELILQSRYVFRLRN